MSTNKGDFAVEWTAVGCKHLNDGRFVRYSVNGVNRLLHRIFDTSAQQGVYKQALAEIKSACKRSHWMWFIFPQFDGLAFGSTSKFYSIKSFDEARAYLANSVLGRKLLECAEAVMSVENKSAHDIFGSPDDLKLRSSATLFAYVLPAGSVFERLLAKYYNGQRDAKTLQLLEPD